MILPSISTGEMFSPYDSEVDENAVHSDSESDSSIISLIEYDQHSIDEIFTCEKFYKWGGHKIAGGQLARVNFRSRNVKNIVFSI